MSSRLPASEPAAPDTPQRRADAKHEYLRHAVALASSVAAAGGTVSPFAHVSLGAVAAAAGVNRSTLYRHWPSQHEFWDDLLAFVLAGGPEPASTLPSPAPDGLEAAADGTIHDAVQDLLLTGREPLVETGLVGHPVGAAGRDAVAARRSDRIAALTTELEHVLAASGEVCAPGFSTRDLAVAFTIIGTGLPIAGRLARRPQLRIESSAYSGPEAAGRSLFGSLQVILRTALTRPGPRRAPPEASPAPRANAPIPNTPIAVAATGRRKDYLRIAAELAVDPDTNAAGIGRALRYLTLDGLARDVGVTRRTLGNVWPDQASFRLDLLAFLLHTEREELALAVRGARRAAIGEYHPEPQDVFLDLGERVHRSLLRRRTGLSFLAFGPHLDDVHVADRARREHDRALLPVRQSLDLLFRTLGLRPRLGVSSEHVAVAFLVVCDGINRLVRTDPAIIGSTGGARGAPRSLAAVTLAAVLAGFTEPAVARPQVARYLGLVS